MERAVTILEAACGPVFPGAVACVLHRGHLVLHAAVGHRALVPVPEPNACDTIYDLASLTKPMVVGTLLLRSAVDLDESAGPWPGVTVRHLAGHTSGLPPFRDVASIDEVLATPLVTPPGERAVYSDLGYMALGAHLERRLGAPLDVLAAPIFRELGLADTGYRPAPSPRIAPTEVSEARGVIRGEVHDPNAWRLGGVAGHAGLFGTALDVATWAQSLLSMPRAREFWTAPSIARTPTSWRLCFDTVTPGMSSAGRHFGPRAVGHLGFTGTSVWIEPDREWVVVLLSNRVHPRPHDAIKALRPRFHDAVAEDL